MFRVAIILCILLFSSCSSCGLFLFFYLGRARALLPRGRTLRLFLSKHVRPATLKPPPRPDPPPHPLYSLIIIFPMKSLLQQCGKHRLLLCRPFDTFRSLGRGQSACSHWSWASLLGSLPVSYCKNWSILTYSKICKMIVSPYC